MNRGGEAQGSGNSLMPPWIMQWKQEASTK